MSRRTLLLGCLFAATSLTSTGCHGLFRPWLWNWPCRAGCYPAPFTPPASEGPMMASPMMAGPMMAGPAIAGPVGGHGLYAPVMNGPMIGGASPAECACFSPGSSVPIASTAPPVPHMPTYDAPPTFNGPMPTYTVPPSVYNGQPSTLMPPPQVLQEGDKHATPMPATPPKEMK